MRIYISGRITGNPDYKLQFELTEQLLNKCDSVTSVVNPARLDLGEGATWEDYMKTDIVQLTSCDVICMLKGWRRSRGARLEYRIAKALGLKVIYER